MTITLPFLRPGTGRRQRNSLGRARAENGRLREENARLARELDEHHRLFAELGDAYVLLRDQFDDAGIELSGLRLDNQRLTTQLKRQAGKVVRADADVQRLREAVHRARPKITFAVPPRVPPYAPLETVPVPDAIAPLPVGRWLPFPPDPGEDTQEIALGDLIAGRI